MEHETPLPYGPARPAGVPQSRSAPGPRGWSSIRRVLLATDLSDASGGATEQAFELARQLGSRLLILSVIEPALSRSARVAGAASQRLDQRRNVRESAAQDVVRRGRARGLSVEFLVWEGEPGQAIVDAATSEQVDLVVVGSHGRGSIGRLLIGSVSEYVVRHAHCPVLVVRGRPG